MHLMNRKHSILVWVLALILFACSQAPDSTSVEQDTPAISFAVDSLQASLQALADTMDIIGFGVAVVDETGVLYADGFGKSDVAKNVPYTKNTTQNIASISKVFIGLSMAKAQEMGLLALNDPINKHLPFEVQHPSYRHSIIRIQHLVNHTSGITDSDAYDLSYRLALGDTMTIPLMAAYGDGFLPDTAWTLQQYLQDYLTTDGSIYSAENFNEYAPGVRFDYSNIGASLAALVIESASGMSFGDFSTKYVLDPLQMTTSTWSMDEVVLDTRTRNYGDDELQLPYYRLITYPDGGMNSSANEMGLFLSELMRGQVGKGTLLNEQSYSLFYTPTLDTIQNPEQEVTNAFNDEYNMGIFIGQSGTGNWGHSGGDPGTATLMFFDPELKLGQLMMVNCDLNNETYFEYIGIWQTLCTYTGMGE